MYKLIALTSILLAGLVSAENFTLVYEDANISELRGVFAFASGTVWAVGTDGKVLKSTNGGSNWSSVVISGASGYHLNAVFFSDADRGCIVGEKKAAPNRFMGKIYRTTNGGSSWDASISYSAVKDRPFKDIAFDIREGGHSYEGRIAAGQGYLYVTSNYGETWSTYQPVPARKDFCFHGIVYNLSSSQWIAAGDAGTATGIVVTSDAGVEYPYSELDLNFFGTGSYGNFRVAASKGYVLKKSIENWSNTHILPDQNVFYGINSVSGFTTTYPCAGSDEAFVSTSGNVISHNYGKCLLDVSPAKSSGYGPSLISNNVFAVGRGGRIYKYVLDDDPWPATMSVYGESQRVRCVITDSEDPSYAYVYRSTCPDGPYQLVAEFDIPVGTSTWYDNTVDFNVDYYYRIGNLPASNNPAHPSNLPDPSNPPQPPASFNAEDVTNDDGGRAYLTWYWQSQITYALYRDGACIYIGQASEHYDNAAVTGSNHTYKVRIRKYYAAENDYIYSAPVTAYCTPQNNLNPSAPSGLAGERSLNPDFVQLRWTAPSSTDLHGYYVYRKIGMQAYAKVNNVPAPRCFWYDEPNSGDILKYKVTAVDWSGRESGYSNEVVFDAQGDPTKGGSQDAGSVPAAGFGLRLDPNPCRGLPQVGFCLAEPAAVRLALYGAAGQLIRQVDLGAYPAGRHCYAPGPGLAAGLASGVYFVELRAGGHRARARCVIWR